MYDLWDYQETNVAAVIDFFDHGGKSVVLQQPTGTGKSLVATAFIQRFKEQSKPVYFITQSSNLLWQFSETLTEYGLRHGIIKAGCPTLRYRVQVISVQSLLSRINQIDEPFALIVEETHHAASEQFKKVFAKWPNVKLLGLSATPSRPDGKPLDMFEHLIQSPQLRWFIDNYYLSDYEYFVPAEVNTEGLHHQCGDFKKSELNERLDEDTARIGNFVKHYQKYANNLPGIAFGVSIADAESIGRKFVEAGYNMKALHSGISDVQELLKQAKKGVYPLISTCDLIGEGTDIKKLECMMDGRPTESIVIQIQHWGRPLRAVYAPGHDLSTIDGRRAAMIAGGKGKAQILDFSSNYLRHGLPDDERVWSLQGAVKVKTASKYKRCPNCQRPVPTFASTCPYCAYSFPVIAAEVIETPEREGELIPISELKSMDKNALTIKIAREARDLKGAIRIAKAAGANHQAAWYIWKIILKKSV
jgi:superfamily II DNA or RNA helicase